MLSVASMLLASVGDCVVSSSWLMPIGVNCVQQLKLASDQGMLLRSRATSGGRSPTTGQA